mmetsp:Transcript_29818/g.77179  ORF Transcript_29818/g.77179 Transcript_29818/m.77179 type:complete len:286 (+) Transcript_29818:1225-2082(+)
MDQLAHRRTQIDLDAALLEVFQDRVVKERLRRPVEHAQHGRLGADGEEHEDSEHAAGGDVVAVNEAECVRDRVPHAINGAARRALEGPLELREPLGEGNVVELTNHVHATVEVHERAHDWASAEAKRIRQLIAHAQLLRPCERLQARHRCADREAEIELANTAAIVDERVRVLLEPEEIVRAGALHNAEEIVVAPEEDVQPHLDVVAVLVLPAAHLATDKWAQLKHLHLVAGVGEVHRRDHASKTSTDDANLELLFVHDSRPLKSAVPKSLVEEGIVAHLRLRTL